MQIQQEKVSLEKRIGYFFLSLTPALCCVVMQLLVTFVYVIGLGIARMLAFMGQNPAAGADAGVQVFMEAYMDAVSGGVLWYHILSLPVFGLWFYFGCGRRGLKRAARNVTAKALCIALAGGVVVCLFANASVGVEQFLIPDILESYLEMAELAGMGESLMTILASVVLAPVGEELLCRGLILHYAKKSLPRFWMANILQALLFALIHGNLIQGLFAFVAGLMLGYLAERYQSLLPGMLLHFVVNFSSTFWIDKVFLAVPDTLQSYSILCVVSLAVLAALVWWGGSVGNRQERN